MNVSSDAAFDVVAVDAVESRAATGVFLEEREKAFHAALFARFFGSGRIGRGLVGGRCASWWRAVGRSASDQT